MDTNSAQRSVQPSHARAENTGRKASAKSATVVATPQHLDRHEANPSKQGAHDVPSTHFTSGIRRTRLTQSEDYNRALAQRFGTAALENHQF